MSQRFCKRNSWPFHSKAPFHHEPIPLLNGKEKGRTTIGIKTSIHINSLEARNPATLQPMALGERLVSVCPNQGAFLYTFFGPCHVSNSHRCANLGFCLDESCESIKMIAIVDSLNLYKLGNSMVPFLDQLRHTINSIIAIDPRSGLLRHCVWRGGWPFLRQSGSAVAWESNGQSAYVDASVGNKKTLPEPHHWETATIIKAVRLQLQ